MLYIWYDETINLIIVEGGNAPFTMIKKHETYYEEVLTTNDRTIPLDGLMTETTTFIVRSGTLSDSNEVTVIYEEQTVDYAVAAAYEDLPEVAYDILIRAYDEQPEVSYDTLQVVYEDLVSPTPGNLTGRTISSTQLEVSSSFSTDDRGIAKTELYRNGSLIMTYQNGVSFVFGDVGLMPGASYSYYTIVYDASGNFAQSATLTLTTAESDPITDIKVIIFKSTVSENLNLKAVIKDKFKLSAKI